MADLEKLRADYEQAEAKAHALQSDKDAALQKVLDKYRERQQAANVKAAEAQRALCDAEAGQALRERHTKAMDDGDEAGAAEVSALAETLGLNLNA